MLDQKGERLSKPPHCPDDVYKVMLQCWQYEPTLRPTFRRLHELFDKGGELGDYPNNWEFLNEKMLSFHFHISFYSSLTYLI